MEARSFSPERSRQLLVKVKEYKADLAKLRTDASTAAAQVPTQWIHIVSR